MNDGVRSGIIVSVTTLGDLNLLPDDPSHPVRYSMLTALLTIHHFHAEENPPLKQYE